MRHRCSATDIAQLVSTLSLGKGQGPLLAREIRAGAVTVFQGQITRSADLGRLKHCWRAADGPPGVATESHPRLIVQNSIDRLRSWNTENGRIHVGRIRDRMEELLAGVPPAPLVLGWDAGEWVLKEGNYTAAALYHTWVERPPQPIQVYTLEPIDWSQAPSLPAGTVCRA